MRVRDGDNIADADSEMLPIVVFSWTLLDRHLGIRYSSYWCVFNDATNIIRRKHTLLHLSVGRKVHDETSEGKYWIGSINDKMEANKVGVASCPWTLGAAK